MKTRQTEAVSPDACAFPDDAALAALRSWYAGVSARESVDRYLGHADRPDVSARTTLARIRRQLVACAQNRHRPDLAELFVARPAPQHAAAIARAIEVLRPLPLPEPQPADSVGLWLPPRIAAALDAHGIGTLADLIVREQRRRRWWKPVNGLGAKGAAQIRSFLARHPDLTDRARATAAATSRGPITPWEVLRVPLELDGSGGQFRAPQEACLLNAANDYEAVRSWLSLHDSVATARAYRKEAERLMLWAIVERGRALSSLTTDDAIAYRSFLRHPAPVVRWTGPPRPRDSAEWRPFARTLSPRSTAHALTVLSAMYRWLVEQRYVFANPFAGVRVRAHARTTGFDARRSFTESEWRLLRTVADGLEWAYGWSEPAAQRLRFVLDFGYATGLRAGELVGTTLGHIETDEHGDHWLHVSGKGGVPGKVGLPPLARRALERYLVQQQLCVTPSRWNPATPVVAHLDDDGAAIATLRLGRVLRRFFLMSADVVQEQRPALAGKLRRASPHWIRHTHASHALAHGVKLLAVRDNLRHASIATTSLYLHGDDAERARQLDGAFRADQAASNNFS
ncbi:Site-specific recombinase XerD [Paraburkholderia tropica]